MEGASPLLVGCGNADGEVGLGCDMGCELGCGVRGWVGCSMGCWVGC